MKIDWQARLKSKTFWVALTSIVLVLTQQVLSWFGIEFSKELIENQAIQFINTVFLLLGILGVINDPTTLGISDSERVLNRKDNK